MKKAMALLGCVLIVIGLGLSWIGGRLGGSSQATVRLFGHTWEVFAPTAGHFGQASFLSADEAERSPSPEPAATTGMATQVDPFQRIDLDIDLGEVSVVTGDDFFVDISYWGSGYEITWEHTGDTLSVRSSTSGITSTPDCGSSILLYVPANAELDQLDLNVDLGSITLAGLTVCDAELNLELGDLTGEGLTVYDTLFVEADLGSVALYGDLGQTVDVTADLGSITLGLYRPSSSYRWDLSADLGSILVDGQQVGSGFSGTATGGTGGRCIYAEASLGEIRLEFSCEPGAYVVEGEASSSIPFSWGEITAVEDSSAPMPPSVVQWVEE